MALFGVGNKKKIEELKQQLDEQNFEQAAMTADKIPVKWLKSAYELNLVGKADKCNGDFLQAKYGTCQNGTIFVDMEKKTVL